MNGRNCVFYIANQHQYAIEAGKSAASLKATTPGVETVLFVSGFSVTGGFDKVRDLPFVEGEPFYLKHCKWMLIAIRTLIELGYEKAVFADCDTYFCADIGEIFEMLDYFDIMGAFAPARRTTVSVGRISHSVFPEINIGFTPMAINPAMVEFWKGIVERYENHQEEYENNDQGPFRDELIECVMRRLMAFGFLPPEWNCRFNFPCMVAGEVKVLHGRNNDLDNVARAVNTHKGMRSWKKIDELTG